METLPKIDEVDNFYFGDVNDDGMDFEIPKSKSLQTSVLHDLPHDLPHDITTASFEVMDVTTDNTHLFEVP